MAENKAIKHGGKREGAGRKKIDDQRQSRTLRALPDEWELIRQFAKELKHGNKALCESFLNDLKIGAIFVDTT